MQCIVQDKDSAGLLAWIEKINGQADDAVKENDIHLDGRNWIVEPRDGMNQAPLLLCHQHLQHMACMTDPELQLCGMGRWPCQIIAA